MAADTEAVLMDLFGPSPDDDQFSATEEAPTVDLVGEEEGVANEVIVDEQFLEHGPQSNMEFSSRETLFAAYQAHAKHKGFSVAYRTENEGKYLVICCDRGRKSAVKKSTKRIDCRARINAIKQDNGCWKVSTVCSIHNHDLDPHMSIFMPGHRSLSINMRRQLEAYDIVGLRPCKNVRILEVQAGGPENLGCLGKDCRNYIEERRRLRLGEGDAEAIRKLFMRLQQKDKSFFHLMDIDDEGKLRNVMWIHPRSIAAYENFHDVVSFDTTYLVNQYKMPFATVVGVNHHHQSILLGCALLSHEDSQSFNWFFTNWLEAMGGIQPTAILTDQCGSIRTAIREVMPNTIHRLCLWHIVMKAGQKLKGVASFDKVISEFNAIIYNSRSISEFEEGWTQFIVAHGLEENRWLRDLYHERQNWVHVYLNHIFWAGMVSTQRSESMHAFFDHYIHSRSTLKQFVEQYEIAISHKVQKELRADYESKCRSMKCISSFEWEEQFRTVYTNSIFELFQKEITLMWNCNVMHDPTIDGEIKRYEVIDTSASNIWFRREYTFMVEYRPIGSYLECNCRKFESKGILCCHILKVLSLIGIRSVNERYIMQRWRKDVYRRHSSIFFAGGYPHMTNEYKRFQQVEREFQECTDMAYQCPDKMDFIEERLKDIKLDLLKWKPSLHQHGVAEQPNSNLNHILNPNVVQSRGRPRMNRMKPTGEISKPRRGRGRGRGGSNQGRG